jgi:hypothetical protein
MSLASERRNIRSLALIADGRERRRHDVRILRGNHFKPDATIESGAVQQHHAIEATALVVRDEIVD